MLHHTETLSLSEPVLAETAVHITVGLFMHRGRAADQGELAAPRPHRLAGVGTRSPLAPSRVESLVELEHTTGLPAQLAPFDNGEVGLAARAGLFALVPDAAA